jgi:hypothetical protein
VEAAVGRVARRRPPRDDLRLGAGERDVEVAQLLSGLLPQVSTLVVRPSSATTRDVDHAGAELVVVAGDVDRPDEVHRRERQVHDGVLQALALVDRRDLDRCGIAVETTHALGGDVLALGPEPLQQSGQPE